MKPRGRSPRPFSDMDLEMIKLYLESDLSYVEVSERFGVSPELCRYRVNKWRKQQQQKEVQVQVRSDT